MNIADINTLIKFRDEGPTKQIFHDSGDIKAQIVCLKAGQKIPPCSMDHDVLFCVLSGSGTIIVDDQQQDLDELSAVVVAKKAGTRSIRAAADMVLLAVQAVAAES